MTCDFCEENAVVLRPIGKRHICQKCIAVFKAILGIISIEDELATKREMNPWNP